jgi:hypothetical protein
MAVGGAQMVERSFSHERNVLHIGDRSKLTRLPVEETYGFGILNEGLAIGVAKNIKIRPNEFTLPARTVVDISGANSEFQEIDTVSVWGATPIDVNAA